MKYIANRSSAVSPDSKAASAEFRADATAVARALWLAFRTNRCFAPTKGTLRSSGMTLAIPTVVAFASLAITPVVSAAMVTFTNKALWNGFVTAQGNTVNIETFEAFADGMVKSATATTGTTTWHAIATPGPLVFSHFGGNQTIGTASAGVILNFTFTPAVKGFGGHFFGLDSNDNVVPVILGVQLADGSAYVGSSTSPADFIGFYSTGSPIASLEWSYPNPDTRIFVDDLYFAAIGSVVDIDGDGRPDSIDNCPTIANATQADCDNDGVGDVCEIAASAPDYNQDGIPDTCQCGTIPSLPACCPGDFDHDAAIGGADIGLLMSNWGPCGSACLYDLNNDGKVSGGDLGLLLSGWGPCPN